MKTFDSSVPTGESNFKVQKSLAKDIAEGKYKIGQPIATQEFIAVKLNFIF